MKFLFVFLLFFLFIPYSIWSQSADSIINKYINALGGREKLEKVKDRTTYLSGKVEGTSVTVTIFQKDPNLFRQDISSKNINQVLYYNGSKGVLVSDAGETELKGQTLKDLQYDAFLNPVLDLKAIGVTATYAGKEELNGKEAHKIKLQVDNTKRWIEFYDPETGLKLRQIKTISSSSGNFDQITDFSDYRIVEDIKYPFKLIQSIGEQKIEMDVKLIKINTGIEDDHFNHKRD